MWKQLLEDWDSTSLFGNLESLMKYNGRNTKRTAQHGLIIWEVNQLVGTTHSEEGQGLRYGWLWSSPAVYFTPSAFGLGGAPMMQLSLICSALEPWIAANSQRRRTEGAHGG